MASIKIKVKNEDESHPLSRKLSISTGSSSLTTPIRALHLKQETTSESRLIQNEKVRGLNEIYHELTKQRIEDIDNDYDKLQDWGKRLRYIVTMPKIKDELNLLFFSYQNKDTIKGIGNTLPTDKEIEYLCNIVTHPSSEIIVLPIIPELSGSEYLKFLKKFFVYLKSYRKKQVVMGNIPLVSTSELREINQFYLEKEINLFSVDFDGNNPIDSYILVNEVRKLTNTIRKEYKEDSFMHAFNIPLPKSRPSTYITPAKDMMTLTSGFDSFGTSHKKIAMPPKVIEKIKEKIKENKLEAKRKKISYLHPFRLFNEQDYGYYKNDATLLEEIFKDTKKTVIKLSDLTNPEYSETKQKGLRRAFNVERQALESIEYHKLIEENCIAKHIQKKEYGKDNFGRIARLIQ